MQTHKRRPTHHLSRREAQIMLLIMEGHSYPEAAGVLRLSAETVRSHVRHIRDKLNIRRKPELAVWATQHKKRLWQMAGLPE